MNEIRSILKLNADNLKKTQLEALKKHSTELLQDIIGLINTNQFDKVLDYTCDSPSGDGMGLDNTFINFDFSDNSNGDDISSLIHKLKSLYK